MARYAGRSLAVAFDSTPIGQLTAFDPIGSSRGQIDASAYGDDWTSTVSGLQDGNEVNFTIAYDPADGGHQDIFDAYADDPDTPVTLNVTHSVSGFDADVTVLVTALSIGGALDGMFEMTGTFKIQEPGVVLNS